MLASFTSIFGVAIVIGFISDQLIETNEDDNKLRTKLAELERCRSLAHSLTR